MSLVVEPLGEAYSFGSRIRGLSRAMLDDADVKAELIAVFEARGLIVFEDVEPTGEMHVALSTVFGPLKEHPVPAVPRVAGEALPGVIDMHRKPSESAIVEIDGLQLIGWLPWHFDHCYNNELNRAGVLRALEIPPEGGLTGFCDGIELYNSLTPALRDQIESRKVIYTLDLIFDHMRFGLPQNFRSINVPAKQYEFLEQAKRQPRAIHPAVWARPDGQKVFHVSPWMSVGIEGHEDPDGDALLQAVCEEIAAKADASAYRHRWKKSDMLIWDNWRMLHSVTGCSPQHERRMQRTTIKGDYGLGYFEGFGAGGELLEMTV